MKLNQNLFFLSWLIAAQTAAANSQQNLISLVACTATVTWGDDWKPGDYQEIYLCASSPSFFSKDSKWCGSEPTYNPCPQDAKEKLDCGKDTRVTSGNATLFYLYPDANIKISDDCAYAKLR